MESSKRKTFDEHVYIAYEQAAWEHSYIIGVFFNLDAACQIIRDENKADMDCNERCSEDDYYSYFIEEYETNCKSEWINRYMYNKKTGEFIKKERTSYYPFNQDDRCIT